MLGDRAVATLRLIKGKCAGKNGDCHEEELVENGLCAECVAEDIDQSIRLAQSEFDRLLRRFPDQSVRAPHDLVNEPAKHYDVMLGAIRASVREGNFPGLSPQAKALATEIALWMANELNRRVGRSAPEAEAIIYQSKQKAAECDFAGAIELAEQSISVLEPFEKVRVNLRQRFAERSRARQTPGDSTSEPHGDQTRAS